MKIVSKNDKDMVRSEKQNVLNTISFLLFDTRRYGFFLKVVI